MIGVCHTWAKTHCLGEYGNCLITNLSPRSQTELFSTLIARFRFSNDTRFRVTRVCAYGNRLHLCIDGRIEILIDFTMFQTWSCFRLTSRHAPRCLLLHPSRTGLIVALFLIEVLVDRLIDFFVSGSSVTQQTLVNSALVAKPLALDRHCSATIFWGVSHTVICCVELCSGPPTAFPLIGPQCTVGVLAGTHWGAH